MTDVQARFQAALLRLLRQDLPAPTIRDRLHADPTLSELADYIASLDLHALAVAQALVAKWHPTDAS